MTRLPLTICLALAWFLAVNTLVSVAVATAGTWYSTRSARRGHVAVDGQLALAWRLLPAGLASAVVAVFVPAFLAYEPSWSPEPVGWTLRLSAVATLALVAAACGRGALLALRARSIVGRWQVDAVPLEVPGLSGTRIRAYAVHDVFPVVALVGVWRPRLFVARQVLAVLSATELKPRSSTAGPPSCLGQRCTRAVRVDAGRAGLAPGGTPPRAAVGGGGRTGGRSHGGAGFRSPRRRPGRSARQGLAPCRSPGVSPCRPTFQHVSRMRRDRRSRAPARLRLEGRAAVSPRTAGARGSRGARRLRIFAEDVADAARDFRDVRAVLAIALVAPVRIN
jgi:hypothetical protein